ncbi:hypothetical protein GS483_19715 [Rhodococcus hoagii]|nr:hypothetical protein [Prescottella equi]
MSVNTKSNGQAILSAEQRVDDEFRPRSSAAVGLLLGLAAATPGVASLVPSLGIRPWHVFVLVALVITVVDAPDQRLRRLRVTALDISVLVYASAFLLVEYFNAGDLGFRLEPAAALSPFLMLAGFYSARLAVSSLSSARTLLIAFGLPAVPIALISALQIWSPSVNEVLLRIAPSSGLEGRLVDGRLIRATGFVGHWTGLGFYFCVVLAAACTALVLFLRAGRRPPVSVQCILAASALGAVSSLTISVVATALVVGVATVFAVGAKVGRIAALVALCGLLYFQFGEQLSDRVDQQTTRFSSVYVPSWVPNTIAYRWEIWVEQTIPAIEERMLTGWGTNIYSSATRADRPSILRWTSPESQWFGSAVASGVVVTALLALALLVALRMISRGACEAGGRWRIPMVALLVSAITASLTVPVFTNRGLPIGIWILFGVVVAVGAVCSKEDSSDFSKG